MHPCVNLRHIAIAIATKGIASDPDILYSFQEIRQENYANI